MGDPWAAVKLFEFFSECYAEQYDIYRKDWNIADQTKYCL